MARRIVYVYSKEEYECGIERDRMKGQALIIGLPLLVLLILLAAAFWPREAATVNVQPVTATFEESCAGWSSCSDGVQTNRCIDPYGNRIEYERECLTAVEQESLCTPIWECGYWSDCTIIGQRFRHCNDGCGNVRTEDEYCRDCVVRCDQWSVCIRGSQWRTCGNTWCGGSYSTTETRCC